MRVASMTHIGRVRRTNEDCVRVVQEAGLLIIADGMGGHRGGQIASTLAAEGIGEFLRARLTEESTPAQIRQLIEEAVRWAGSLMQLRAAADPELQGMGTTIVLAVCRKDQIHLAHMGDSRAYLLTEGRLRCLTRDHSLVNEMIESGQLTPRRAKRHPLRNVITRSLGTRGECALDYQVVPWKRGDILLLCSDGLTNMVEEEDMRELILRGGGDLERTCRALVEAANAKGGRDNISVILAMEE